MEIKFSRHAKRRAKLYNISESTISNILAGLNLHHGEHDIIRTISGYRYPVKIVVSVERDSIIVITNYPLKKGRGT